MSDDSFETSTGNVFADLGIPNAAEHLLKARLVHKIATIMKDRSLTQAQLAGLLGVRQPDVSAMLRGRFRRVSVEKLLRHLVALGQDVEIVVRRPRSGRRGAELRVA